MTGGHGHVTPRPDGAKARCGGPAICSECARELVAKAQSAPRCLHCLDTGHVCENHPEFPWEGLSGPVEGHNCQGAGMPCPHCCSPIPEDGTHSIVEAFVPDWQRGGT